MYQYITYEIVVITPGVTSIKVSYLQQQHSYHNIPNNGNTKHTTRQIIIQVHEKTSHRKQIHRKGKGKIDKIQFIKEGKLHRNHHHPPHHQTVMKGFFPFLP